MIKKLCILLVNLYAISDKLFSQEFGNLPELQSCIEIKVTFDVPQVQRQYWIVPFEKLKDSIISRTDAQQQYNIEGNKRVYNLGNGLFLKETRGIRQAAVICNDSVALVRDLRKVCLHVDSNMDAKVLFFQYEGNEVNQFFLTVPVLEKETSPSGMKEKYTTEDSRLLVLFKSLPTLTGTLDVLYVFPSVFEANEFEAYPFDEDD